MYCKKNQKWQLSWQFVQYGGLNPVAISHSAEMKYTPRLQYAITYKSTLMWLLKRNAYGSKLSMCIFAKTCENSNKG